MKRRDFLLGAALAAGPAGLHRAGRLASMSFLPGLDFSKFDPDKPMGEFTTNGMQTRSRARCRGHGDRGDGFLVTVQFRPRYVQSIVDESIPALCKRKLTRREYSHDHFRDNMTAF